MNGHLSKVKTFSNIGVFLCWGGIVIHPACDVVLFSFIAKGFEDMLF